MARLLLVVALVAAASCTPEITGGTYYCGPERLCPPDLACDGVSYLCETPGRTVPFSCPPASQDGEPDDDEESARDLGVLACGRDLLSSEVGCIDDADDGDYYGLRSEVSCTGADPHLELALRFPVAFQPLTLEVLDGSGNVVGVGQVCTPDNDQTGTELVCLEIDDPDGALLVRVRRADDSPDCSGDCAFNRYVLSIRYPLG